MSKKLLDQEGNVITSTQEVPTEENKEFAIYPHIPPSGRFIGEYLQPPPSTSITIPQKYNPMERTNAEDALRKYYIGPSLIFIHQVGKPKNFRDYIEEIEIEQGDIVISQGAQDAHILNGKLYTTSRFDGIIVIIKKGTEDNKKILEYNKINL